MKKYLLNSNFKSIVIFITIVLILTLGIVYNLTKNDTDVFKSNFKNIPSRTWIGSEYWANPLQDWQIDKDRIECLVSNSNRNIHHLTRQLGPQDGSFEMQVSLGLLNSEIAPEKNNWVGFCIGVKGEFDDNRNHAVFGKGLNIGIGTNGALFIGQKNKNNKSVAIIKAMKSGVDLYIKATPFNGDYKIEVSVFELGTKKLLSSISKRNVASEILIGDLVLMSNFQSKESKRVYKKSVWFKDWEIKGTKIVSKDEQSFGPILYSQYTLNNKTLKINVQLAPVDHPTKKVKLQVLNNNNKWKTISEESINKTALTATFKIEDWDDTKDYKYRLVSNIEIANKKNKEYYWEGIIRKNSKNKNDFEFTKLSF